MKVHQSKRRIRYKKNSRSAGQGEDFCQFGLKNNLSGGQITAINTQRRSTSLLGFTQSTSTTQGTRTLSSVNTRVSYGLDAAGNLTSDGLRSYAYDSLNRLAKVRLPQGHETSSISYWHNAQGQRVFKGQAQAEKRRDQDDDERELGKSFPSQTTRGCCCMGGRT